MSTAPADGRTRPPINVEHGGFAAAGRADDGDELSVGDIERDTVHRGDLTAVRAKGLAELADDDSRAPEAQDLNLARAFFAKVMSTAFAYGTGFSRASGTQTFMPFAYDASSRMKSQSKIVL